MLVDSSLIKLICCKVSISLVLDSLTARTENIHNAVLKSVVFIRLNLEFSLYRDLLKEMICEEPSDEEHGGVATFPTDGRNSNNLASVFNQCCYSHFFFQLCQNNEDEMFKTVFFSSSLMMRVSLFFSPLCNPPLKKYCKTLKLRKTNKASASLF